MKIFKKLAFLLLLTASSNILSDSYSYIDLKVGSFIRSCTDKSKCQEIDGYMPTYISVGRHWNLSNSMDLEVEYMHRSNADIEPRHNDKYGFGGEYDRDGVFVKVRYKFLFSD